MVIVDTRKTYTCGCISFELMFAIEIRCSCHRLRTSPRSFRRFSSLPTARNGAKPSDYASLGSTRKEKFGCVTRRAGARMDYGIKQRMIRVQASEAPALANKPTLRAPPKKPAPPPALITRIRQERDRQFGNGPPQQQQQQQQPQQGQPGGNSQNRNRSGQTPPHQQPSSPSNNIANASRPGTTAGAQAARPHWSPARSAPPRWVKPGKPEGGQDGANKSAGRPKQRGNFRNQDVKKSRITRGTRRRDRAIAKEKSALVRQEIFEVSDEGMPVEELARLLAIGASEVVKSLFMKGIMVQVNQVIDKEAVHLVVADFDDVEVLDKEEVTVDEGAKKVTAWIDEEDLTFLQPRPPVVTIMGHVDHGKTSLLDFVRKTKVAAGEAGGITQAIGAYTVTVPHDGKESAITFVDTPGHEAFSAMRARGTKITDLAVIVVAADDGVRPQTQEAISHAKAANVPIVIALNKIDKEGAQLQRVQQELADIGVLPEEWGGDTPVMPISAKHGQGVDELLEQILLQAEVAELQANPSRLAKGTVIEAHLDRRRGPVATLLVQAGTLRVGDMVVASATFGKVKSLSDSVGTVQDATPSLAVQMVGLGSVPVAGDEFYVCVDENAARKAAESAGDTQRTDRLAASAGGGSIVTTKSWAKDDNESLQRLNVILKTDASGTLEAVKSALSVLPQELVILRFLFAAPSQITISDIDLATASSAMILGFNTEPSDEVQAAAKEKGVELRTYKVIYDLVDDVRAAMEGRLVTVEERTELGQAEVRATFGSGNRIVAGCMVNEGSVRKGCLIVVRRGKRVVYEGPLTSLRRVKDDVAEVSRGLECGLRVDGFTSWREGDKIEAFAVADKRRTLEEAAVTQAPEKVSELSAEEA